MSRGAILALCVCTLTPGCKRDAGPDATSPGGGGPAAADRPGREPIEASPAARAVVAAEDRTDKDRETDERRFPAQMLTFMGVRPGMKVLDLAAGSGYTTELLVRSVQPDGVVYAQNNAETIEKFVRESWPQRLARDVNRDVIRVDREYSDPVPDGVRDLDLVTIVFSYHDVMVQGHDVEVLNAKVFEALAPGGLYVVLDHAAPRGTGTSTTQELHRIDELTVIDQVTAAGFELVESSNFLRDPTDRLDTKVWEVGFVTDRFALKFVKPEA